MFNYLSNYSINEISNAYAEGSLNPKDVLYYCLDNIKNSEGTSNSYVEVLYDSALNSAEIASKEIKNGIFRGPLQGIPVSIKDLCDISGVPTTASSKVLADNIPTKDSWIVDRLKQSGAIIIGKTHTHEFAYGAKTPQTPNPLDIERIAGGSSGGSAASIVNQTAWLSIGTDTAGSVRIPSSLCGIVGFKPSYNLFSKKGVIPLSKSLDHIGLLSGSVQDCLTSFEQLSNNKSLQLNNSKNEKIDFNKIKFGLPVNYYFENICPRTKKEINIAVDKLKSIFSTQIDIEIPLIPETIDTKTKLMMAEASAYHYHMLNRTPELYTEEVRAHLENGMSITAVDYINAREFRKTIKREIDMVFQDIDILITPTVPKIAVNKDKSIIEWPNSHTETINQCYTRFTILANVTGRPAITIPIGGNSELPVGLQLIGKPSQDRFLLEVAAYLQDNL